jgi:adenosylcobinamide kinase / adenosylcobinamide-phosphate guanylyltransferase
MPVKTLVTGGVRSGKSHCAEDLLRNEPQVTYLAPGPPADPRIDPEWATRVAAHQSRRAAHWTTVESIDIAAALGRLTTPALLDCLGTWLSGQLDEIGAWTEEPGWAEQLERRIEELAAAWISCPHRLVAVTNEVGMGLVSQYRSGRVFADWLGRLNQRIAAACDEVILVVAGRRLQL